MSDTSSKEYSSSSPSAPQGQARAAQWQSFARGQGLRGEYALAAALNQPGYDEEQAHMVANLFGR